MSINYNPISLKNLKLGRGKKGEHRSPETEFKKGQPSPLKGKKNPRGSLAKMGANNPMWGKRGILSPYFKGGYKLKLFRNKARKTLKKNASGFHTFEEWELLKNTCGFACMWCFKQEPIIKLTEDHIIPLTKGGSNCIENIQPLCVACNSIKYNKTYEDLYCT